MAIELSFSWSLFPRFKSTDSRISWFRDYCSTDVITCQLLLYNPLRKYWVLKTAKTTKYKQTLDKKLPIEEEAGNFPEPTDKNPGLFFMKTMLVRM